MNFLKEFYPTHNWEEAKFSNRIKKSSQWWLCKIIKDILPSSIELFEEYIHPSLEYNVSGSSIVFDIYIPSLYLVFEYNGYQHYHDHYMFGNVRSFKDLDYKRQEACKSRGLTLVQVPYWWRRDKESILAVLHKLRPDVVPDAPDITPFSYKGTRKTKLMKQT